MLSQETVDDGNGSKLSLEKILEELGTTFSYVSEFLRKVMRVLLFSDQRYFVPLPSW